MLWLYILLGILLVIFLLLLTPVKLKASYNEDFRCILKIGFVKFSPVCNAHVKIIVNILKYTFTIK